MARSTDVRALVAAWLRVASNSEEVHAPASLAAGRVVLNRLERQFRPLVGPLGFRSLLERALHLARDECAGLEPEWSAADEHLLGLSSPMRAFTPAEQTSAVSTLLFHLITLLFTLIGEELVLNIVAGAGLATSPVDREFAEE